MKTFWITTLMLGIFWTPSRKEKGMVQVKENLLYDVGEISNIQWKEFESTLVARGENIEAYRQNEVWTDAIYRDSYFSHPAFANYPVVGITQKGARAFCAWRNQMDQGTPGTFRLPTQAEFQYVLEKGEQSDKWQKRKRASSVVTDTSTTFGKNVHAWPCLASRFWRMNWVSITSKAMQQNW